MGRTFYGGGYSVTVNDDRSILVRPGDWISKYAAAIYGNPKVNWDKFKKKENGQYRRLSNPNLIQVGQRIYHPDPLPGEPGTPAAPANPEPGDDPKLIEQRVRDFLMYIGHWFCPVTEWTFRGSSGGDLSGGPFVGSYLNLQVQRDRDPQPTTFHGVSVGVGAGPEDILGSFSFSLGDFPGVGCVGKFPTAGATLQMDEICGSYIILDLSGGVGLGGSITLLFFGLNGPAQAVVRSIAGYLRGSNDPITVPWLFTGMAVMAGLNACTPNLGVSFKMGIMHRTECVTG